MRITTSCLAICGLLGAIATAASAADLKLGDPAPKLDVAQFVKGKPVAKFDPGTVYVVEFWATWCGPCRQTIPHLTELQKKYKDVVIIGVSIAESDPADVGPFLKEMGDKMDYRVAVDALPGAKEGEGGKMQATWMEAADQDGIPTAFIVDKAGKIAWIGSPSDMDETLDQIVRDKYDLKAALKKGEEQAARKARLDTLARKLGQVDPKSDDAVALLDGVLKEDPALEERLGPLKFRILAMRADAGDRAVTYGRRLVKDVLPENPMIYSGMAWILVDPDRESKASKSMIELALELARKSDKLTEGKDVAAADSLARALFLSGDVPKAVEAQERAVKLAAGTEMEQDEGLKQRLDEYRKAAPQPK